MKTAILLLVLVTPIADASKPEHQIHSREVDHLVEWRQSLQNYDFLKAELLRYLWSNDDDVDGGWSFWRLPDWFKSKGQVSDEQLHSALVEIYREAEKQGTEESSELMLRIALWLSVCGDNATRLFLFDIAADRLKDGFLRTTAFASYLRNANINESKDMLIKFLVDETQGINILSIYSNAAYIHDHELLQDTEKRRAILNALIIAAANDKGKVSFVEVDRILAMRSAAYRHSRERLALLEHHSQAPPTRNLYTDADLERALAEMRRQRSFTSVNTNVALLKAHDFENEPEADELELWGGEIVVPDEAELLRPRGVHPAAESAKPWARLVRWLPVVLPLALLGLFGSWILRRRIRRV